MKLSKICLILASVLIATVAAVEVPEAQASIDNFESTFITSAATESNVPTSVVPALKIAIEKLRSKLQKNNANPTTAGFVSKELQKMTRNVSKGQYVAFVESVVFLDGISDGETAELESIKALLLKEEKSTGSSKPKEPVVVKSGLTSSGKPKEPAPEPSRFAKPKGPRKNNTSSSSSAPRTSTGIPGRTGTNGPTIPQERIEDVTKIVEPFDQILTEEYLTDLIARIKYSDGTSDAALEMKKKFAQDFFKAHLDLFNHGPQVSNGKVADTLEREINQPANNTEDAKLLRNIFHTAMRRIKALVMKATVNQKNDAFETNVGGKKKLLADFKKAYVEARVNLGSTDLEKKSEAVKTFIMQYNNIQEIDALAEVVLGDANANVPSLISQYGVIVRDLKNWYQFTQELQVHLTNYEALNAERMSKKSWKGENEKLYTKEEVQAHIEEAKKVALSICEQKVKEDSNNSAGIKEAEEKLKVLVDSIRAGKDVNAAELAEKEKRQRQINRENEAKKLKAAVKEQKALQAPSLEKIKTFEDSVKSLVSIVKGNAQSSVADTWTDPQGTLTLNSAAISQLSPAHKTLLLNLLGSMQSQLTHFKTGLDYKAKYCDEDKISNGDTVESYMLRFKRSMKGTLESLSNVINNLSNESATVKEVNGFIRGVKESAFVQASSVTPVKVPKALEAAYSDTVVSFSQELKSIESKGAVTEQWKEDRKLFMASQVSHKLSTTRSAVSFNDAYELLVAGKELTSDQRQGLNKLVQECTSSNPQVKDAVELVNASKPKVITNPIVTESNGTTNKNSREPAKPNKNNKPTTTPTNTNKNDNNKSSSGSSVRDRIRDYDQGIQNTAGNNNNNTPASDNNASPPQTNKPTEDPAKNGNNGNTGRNGYIEKPGQTNEPGSGNVKPSAPNPVPNPVPKPAPNPAGPAPNNNDAVPEELNEPQQPQDNNNSNNNNNNGAGESNPTNSANINANALPIALYATLFLSWLLY